MGRSETPESIIQQIAEFFVESEADQCEGPLIDAVTFYLQEYQLPEAV